MTEAEWKQIKYFSSQEFDSHDSPGSGMRMDYEFVVKLDAMRHELGRPVLVMSGVRTFEHNALVGGVDGSAHIAGLAADLYARSSRERFEMVQVALLAGIKRIGIGQTFVHVDADPTKPQDVVWLY